MPFFWDQPNLTTMLLKGSVDLSMRPFLTHMKMLNLDYNGGNIMCVNLVSSENKNENMLKNRYEEMIASFRMKEIQLIYRHFDFHI